MGLAGHPFHLYPRDLLQWTLPQVMFAWASKQEQLGDEAAQTFQLTMLAIGAALSKDGQKVADTVMTALQGGKKSLNEIADELTEEQKLVLFGSKRFGRKTNPDPDTN